ncbi:hypothetical protein DUI87_16404 [Hirundo rustica rustica]|uniref:Uncharacterized protein n=1 Tax=Hirundo rustica rustica TaxID=333673 RepID=A0A3M0K140_HIRRU|nr:hypothetical protein DUI87_16404 [Hirundo rustica rustica]
MLEQAPGRELWTRRERSQQWRQFAGRTPAGDPCWNSLFLKDYTLWEGPTLEQGVPEELHPWERPRLEKLGRTVSCGRGPTLEEKSVRSPAPEEEGVEENV